MSNGASLSRPQQSLIRRVSSRSAASIDMQAGDVHDRRAHTGVEEDVRTRIPVLDNPTAAKIKDDRALTLVGLGFAAASGTLSGMSLVLAKAAVELVDKTKTWFRTGQGKNEFAYFQSWLMVGGLAVGGLSQLVYLNYSLVFASPALICPLAFTFFTMSSILGEAARKCPCQTGPSLTLLYRWSRFLRPVRSIELPGRDSRHSWHCDSAVRGLDNLSDQCPIPAGGKGQLIYRRASR